MRQFIVFPKEERAAAMVAQASAAVGFGPAAAAAGPQPYRSKSTPTIVIADIRDSQRAALEDVGARVFPDVQFKVMDDPIPQDAAAQYWRRAPQPAFFGMAPQVGLREVMQQVNAPAAWQTTRGAGATIAIVDTGVHESIREIAAPRRSSIDLPSAYQGRHWADSHGHGSMCAAIAAGGQNDGGKFDGVAPEATVISARSDLASTDLYVIFDELVAAKRNGEIAGPLVISNSYGLYVCSGGQLPQDHPYLAVILAAIDAGIVVAFAAGNNHADVTCNHTPDRCGPTTIWSVNSHDRVLSVGTVDRNESNRDRNFPHINSSRGPGEWARSHPKPDVVAPTYGEIVWGGGYTVMDWWGTSGACPQVAGLAALMLSVAPTLTPARVADIIRQTARPLGTRNDCTGHGIIDCAAAVQRAVAEVSVS